MNEILRRCCALALAALPLTVMAQSTQAPEGAGREHRLVLPAPTQRADANKGSVQFIGTATVLLRFAGLTILTDPNFLHKGGHVPLGYGLTAERLTEPAIAIEQLPPVDLVVLSHMHGDHFDPLVQEKLDKDIPIVTTPEASRRLDEMGFKHRYALETWDALTVRKGNAILRVTAMPGRHGPPLAASLLPQVMGSILELRADGRSYRIYISGDTLVHDDLREIPQRYPDIDLALLHLGGTRILGVLKVTMDGKDGVRMLQLIAPRHAVPIHYDDYDVFKSPLSEFEAAVKEAGLEGMVTYLKRGEAYEFAAREK